MDAPMMQREIASIRTFGFVDPITVMEHGDDYWIVDGEQRFKAGVSMGMDSFPCVILDGLTEDEARELTIILNEVRGEMDQGRLADLIRDLATRRDRARLDELLPYDRAALDELLQTRRIDWEDVDKPVQERKREEAWVERVFRMPKSSASVLDEAIERVRDNEDIEQDWKALEMIAADYLSGP